MTAEGSFQTRHCGFELALNKRCCASEVPCPRALRALHMQSKQPADEAIKCEVPMHDYLAESFRRVVVAESHGNRLCLKNHPQQVITLLEKVKALSPCMVELSHVS